MTTITPVTTQEPQQATAFKGKGLTKRILNKLATKELTPLEVIVTLNSPLNKAIMEGRSKEEIMEHAIRESAVSGNFKLCSNIAEEFAKKAAKDAYKPL